MGSVPESEGAKRLSTPPISPSLVDSDGIVPNTVSGDKRGKKRDRQFVFANYPCRKIALRLAYQGHVHDGLAKQDDSDNTVEAVLCHALRRVRLIPEDGPANFGRCGRTDKGVSALGNAVSLMARASSWPSDTPQLPPLDYCGMLNHVLPPTVRIIAWSYVDDSFDARFSCISRTYRYYFCHRGLNLDAMKRAAQFLLGTHNFRNYCKMDVVNVSNFERNVLSVGIYESELLPEMISFFEIKANSFLYHQIRCTMEILFLVGRGLEEPEVVQKLLERGDEKPTYPMADGTPLVLWNCEFEGVQWRISHRAFCCAEKELQDICTALLIRATATEAMCSQLFRWYDNMVDPEDGKKVIRRGPCKRTVDQWSITGCDWTDPRKQCNMKVRRYDLFNLMRQEDDNHQQDKPDGVTLNAQAPHIPTNYVPLLQRDTEKTYDEQISELSARKKSRWDINQAKKRAGDERNASDRLSMPTA